MWVPYKDTSFITFLEKQNKLNIRLQKFIIYAIALVDDDVFNNNNNNNNNR